MGHFDSYLVFKYTIVKNIFLIVTILIVNFAYSQEGIKEYVCYKAGAEIEIDGEVYSDDWKSIPWSDFFVDIEGNKKPKPYLSTRMKMLWDENYLYVAAEMEEPHIWGYLNNHDDIIYRDNDFEVFIDPDGDGLNYFEIEINALGTILDLFLAKPYNKKGKADLNWNAEGLKKAVKHYGKLNDTTGNDLKWTMEIAIPWDSYHTRIPNLKKPISGDTWRINFSRVEWKTEYVDGNYRKNVNIETSLPIPENNWVWSPQGKINMHIPEMWGTVTFVDDTAPYPSSKYTVDNYPKFWVWMGGANKTNYEWENIVRKLDDAGIKGFLFGGDTSMLNKVIPIANQYGIQVQAWFWTMNRSDAKPEWLSVNQLGKSLKDEKAYVGYYKFMCPAIPEVGLFIKQKMKELSSVKGLRGIHMDYIRYVDVILPIGLQPKYGLNQDHIMPEFDYGYHPYLRNLYKETYNIDPIDIDDPGNNKPWIKFRLNELNKTVITLRDYVRENDLEITAAVFPTPQMSVDMVRQDWKNWNLDCYFPMVYHNFYNEPISWIQDVMKENRKIIGTKSKIFCGLYLPALKNKDELTNAINAAMTGGADGISLFSYGNLNDDIIYQIKQFTSKQE